jgi:hypothetical protein
MFGIDEVVAGKNIAVVLQNQNIAAGLSEYA